MAFGLRGSIVTVFMFNHSIEVHYLKIYFAEISDLPEPRRQSNAYITYSWLEWRIIAEIERPSLRICPV